MFWNDGDKRLVQERKQYHDLEEGVYVDPSYEYNEVEGRLGLGEAKGGNHANKGKRRVKVNIAIEKMSMTASREKSFVFFYKKSFFYKKVF